MIRAWEAPDAPNDSAIDVTEAPNKQDDSAFDVWEAPDTTEDSVIVAQETADTPADSAIGLPERPQGEIGLPFEGSAPPTGGGGVLRQSKDQGR